jgi:hypothetical protein
MLILSTSDTFVINLIHTGEDKFMKLRSLGCLGVFFAVVLFSYGSANAQVVDAIKDAASKTKEATKKTTVVVTDNLKKAADKTEDATVDGAKKTASTSKKIGSYTINKTESVAGDAYEGGKYYTVKTWDGTKWVSKRVWYKTKRAADATKDAVVGDSDKNP